MITWTGMSSEKWPFSILYPILLHPVNWRSSLSTPLLFYNLLWVGTTSTSSRPKFLPSHKELWTSGTFSNPLANMIGPLTNPPSTHSNICSLASTYSPLYWDMSNVDMFADLLVDFAIVWCFVVAEYCLCGAWWQLTTFKRWLVSVIYTERWIVW